MGVRLSDPSGIDHHKNYADIFEAHIGAADIITIAQGREQRLNQFLERVFNPGVFPLLRGGGMSLDFSTREKSWIMEEKMTRQELEASMGDEWMNKRTWAAATRSEAAVTAVKWFRDYFHEECFCGIIEKDDRPGSSGSSGSTDSTCIWCP